MGHIHHPSPPTPRTHSPGWAQSSQVSHRENRPERVLWRPGSPRQCVAALKPAVTDRQAASLERDEVAALPSASRTARPGSQQCCLLPRRGHQGRSKHPALLAPLAMAQWGALCTPGARPSAPVMPPSSEGNRSYCCSPPALWLLSPESTKAPGKNDPFQSYSANCCMGDGHKNEQKKNPELFSNCIEHLRLRPSKHLVTLIRGGYKKTVNKLGLCYVALLTLLQLRVPGSPSPKGCDHIGTGGDTIHEHVEMPSAHTKGQPKGRVSKGRVRCFVLPPAPPQPAHLCLLLSRHFTREQCHCLAPPRGQPGRSSKLLYVPSPRRKPEP